ncbi:hypothetical protein [Lyngbya confervoides]|uniref:Uncharacterized protein n=1 Tax=Lyngbya confervoides BDU141951 TaxID=1574623 RepID=A0ABD4T3V9_9CYAN|nr:hypothetical protein [Lyngbya confervoides]MCM1983197.1 hypothetical protein [Lyngbya confervoides BDU141951]
MVLFSPFRVRVRDADHLLRLLILWECLLAGVYLLTTLTGMTGPIQQLFDLDREKTIPALFSALQLLGIGVAFWFSGLWSQSYRVSYAGFLKFAGLGFVFLALDEAAAIHERIGKYLRHFDWIPRLSGAHGGVWIWVYLSLALVILVITHRRILALWREHPKIVLLLAAGLGIFLLGAVGMEILSYLFFRQAEQSWLYILQVALEELLEMIGASVVLYAVGVLMIRLRNPHYRARQPLRN